MVGIIPTIVVIIPYVHGIIPTIFQNVCINYCTTVILSDASKGQNVCNTYCTTVFCQMHQRKVLYSFLGIIPCIWV
jgi:hypothetical protein